MASVTESPICVARKRPLAAERLRRLSSGSCQTRQSTPSSRIAGRDEDLGSLAGGARHDASILGGLRMAINDPLPTFLPMATSHRTSESDPRKS
jgi:hypothetical protein